MDKQGKVMGASLLIAGTTIGGAMLAMPVLTAKSGFIPSLVVLFLVWLLMTGTALLYLEICTIMGPNSNLISMAEKTLGPWGKVFAWVSYLFLFFSLLVAYVAGGGDFIEGVSAYALPEWAAILTFVAILAPFVLVGAAAVDRLNWFLIGGLGLAFLWFLWVGVDQVDQENLQRINWGEGLLALPVVFTSFGFQGTIPTVMDYLGRDVKRTRRAILLGSSIPLLVYIIWEWLILGIVPYEGQWGLGAMLKMGKNAVYPLQHQLPFSSVEMAGQIFAFFALTTSFLGVGLSVFDFLCDGLGVKKNWGGRLLIGFLLFAPSTGLAIIFPGMFLFAIHYGAGLGAAFVLVLLPLLMAWSARYRHQWVTEEQVPFGKLFFLIAFIFFVLEVSMDLVF